MSPDNLRLHIVFVVHGLRIYLIEAGGELKLSIEPDRDDLAIDEMSPDNLIPDYISSLSFTV